MPQEVRLQKFMADCGVASRRASEELIRAGKVKVNGHVAAIGDKVNPRRDLVTVRGKKIVPQKELYYIMLHKPRGYVTTVQDEMGRKTVMELVQGVKARLYPVGRLDRTSEGLLLLTNDGAFANAMMHPARHVPKTYRVTVRPAISDEQMLALQEGVVIDGKKTLPTEVRTITEEEGRTVVQMVLHEGRNRQIRRMCEALDLEVARLKRTAVGEVKLGMLQQGQWRHLEPEEKKKLFQACGLDKRK
ncbi:MAG: rRNA pseudouridine synthase [Clostridiales bacterium]|nr:rRNA pseudouridine synthase [Clostridiales bacterium]